MGRFVEAARTCVLVSLAGGKLRHGAVRFEDP